MATRITKLNQKGDSDAPVWGIQGKVQGEYVSLLKEQYASLSDTTKAQLFVNLEQVSYADQNGLKLLLEMEAEGVVLKGVSLFLKELLARAEKRRRPTQNPPSSSVKRQG